jgi:hypothetical protein
LGNVDIKARQEMYASYLKFAEIKPSTQAKAIQESGGVEDYLKQSEAQRKLGELEIEQREKMNALRKEYFETEKKIREVGWTPKDAEGNFVSLEKRRANFIATEAAMRNEYDVQVRLIQAAEEKAKAAEANAKAEKETARILKEQKDIADAAASRAKDRQDAEDRYNQDQIDFLTSLQDALDQQTMTEEELFRKKLANADLSDETTAKAWELFRAIQATKGAAENPVAAMSNVENISTAVGGVKMAGMTTGLDKLAKPAQATAINTAKVAENTGRMANASAAP